MTPHPESPPHFPINLLSWAEQRGEAPKRLSMVRERRCVVRQQQEMERDNRRTIRFMLHFSMPWKRTPRSCGHTLMIFRGWPGS
jgi:hypothetical protein